MNQQTMRFTCLAVDLVKDNRGISLDLAKLGHVTTVMATSSVRVLDFAAGGVENLTNV